VVGVERIDLAHAGDFRLGRVTARPQLRLLLRDDGAEEVVEPRVMQVLVALARANGGIVGRDDLTMSCWEGRVVGEDAINRVISRLRRSAEKIGEGSFRIETVTKVGYRLLAETYVPVPAVADEPLGPSPLAQVRQLKLERRAMLIGSGAAVGVAGLGLWGYRAVTFETPPPREVAPLMAQAMIAAQQGTAEGSSQALGLLRRVVAIRPDYADGWGMLAIVYAGAASSRAEPFEADLRARSEAAARRAHELDGGNAYAAVAWAVLQPRIGGWWMVERTLRAGLTRHGNNQFLRSSLAGLLLSVGRCAESARQIELAVAAGPPSPSLLYSRVQSLWAANRPEEADRAMAEAFALYPSHFAVWFTRFYLLLYTGRAQEALAMSEDLEGRPTGIPSSNFASIEAVARAMLSRAPADIDAAIAANVELAHTGTGFAENTIQFAAALGRVDVAFRIARGYFFGIGFKVGDLRFTPEQRLYSRRRNRRTHFLFYPSTAAMRADPRFELLVQMLGLKRYWLDKGVQPDFWKR
jgi:DNA-binding winged helix-turn-helix (wHTH) protein